MQVDAALISRLEKLARLQLGDSERERLADDLTNILSMVDQLQSVNTDGVAPLTYLTDQIPDLREDVIQQQVSQSEALSNAPKQDGQFFRVPKVVG